MEKTLSTYIPSTLLSSWCSTVSNVFFTVVLSLNIFLNRGKAYSSNSTEFESVILDLIWLLSNDKRMYWKHSEMFRHLNMRWSTESRTSRPLGVSPAISSPLCRWTSFNFEYLFIIFVFCIWMVLLYICMCTVGVPYACGGKKRGCQISGTDF